MAPKPAGKGKAEETPPVRRVALLSDGTTQGFGFWRYE